MMPYGHGNPYRGVGARTRAKMAVMQRRVWSSWLGAALLSPLSPLLAPPQRAAAQEARNGSTNVSAASSSQAVANPQANEWRPWPANRKVPPLALRRLDGTSFNFREQRGRVVLLNFWASWCAPCREEMPSLARLAGSRAEQGLLVVAVNYRESATTVRRFLEALPGALPASLPVLLDEQGEAAKAWTPRIFPTTVFIDRRGRPIGSLVGECDWESAAALERVAPLLASG